MIAKRVQGKVGQTCTDQRRFPLPIPFFTQPLQNCAVKQSPDYGSSLGIAYDLARVLTSQNMLSLTHKLNH